MMRVAGFGVRNLRSLQDTGWIDIKPINILVGKNSAGKSTLARIFPLLKQSAERRKQAPLLWFGRLVDFGSFSDAVSSFATPAEIELRIRFECDPSLDLSRRYVSFKKASNPETEKGIIDATLTLAENSDNRTQLIRLKLNVFGVDVDVAFGSTPGAHPVVANIPALVPTESKLIWTQGVILPQLRVVQTDAGSKRVTDDEFSSPRQKVRLGIAEVTGAISAFVHGNTLTERKVEIAERLPIATCESLLHKCKTLPGTPDTWRSSLANASSTSYNIQKLQKALIIFKLDLLLAELDDVLAGFCHSISYLEPLRATAQRYYRREELSVDELDPKGLNTAFFIQGLSVRERESLNTWLHQTFGFKLRVKSDRGHAALHIEAGENQEGDRNMADVGLGYSQLTPVAIQLWAARHLNRPQIVASRSKFGGISERRENHGPLVVVEQPELHLHPAFQAKIADVFVSCIKRPDGSDTTDNRKSLRIFAETHSSNLISRLGELVETGEVSPQDINILIFEPHKTTPSATSVRVAEFDEDGILKNWPIGFFDY